MNVGVVISSAAVSVSLIVALWIFSLSRAPGWRHFRLFALTAFAVALFAANNLVFTSEGVSDPVVLWAGRLNASLGMVIGGALWAFSGVGSRRDSNAVQHAVLGLYLTFAMVPWLFGVSADSTMRLTMADFGVTYSIPVPGPWTYVVVGSVLFAVTASAWRAWRVHVAPREAGRLGEVRHAGPSSATSSLYQLLGFAVFFAAVLEEGLVYNGLLDWPFIGDIGFVAVIIGVGADVATHIARDARELARLNDELESRVADRSQELLEVQSALLVAERHVAIGQLAAGVGHEINNPLTFVMVNLNFLRELVTRDVERDDLRSEALEAIHDIHEGAVRIKEIVSDLTVFARSASVSDSADVQRASEVALRMVRVSLKHGASIDVDYRHSRLAACSESRLTQVLVNLLVNAVHATSDVTDGPAAVIAVSTADAPDGVAIEIADRGCGIDEAVLGRVFDPLFTTKDVGEGTGLGLFVSRNIVDGVGGTIDIVSTSGEGTTVRVWLPTFNEPA